MPSNYQVSLPATGNPATTDAAPGDTITFTNNTGVEITDFATWTDNNPGKNKIFSPMPGLQTIAAGGQWTSPTINGSAQGAYTYTWTGPGIELSPRSGTIDVS